MCMHRRGPNEEGTGRDGQRRTVCVKKETREGAGRNECVSEKGKKIGRAVQHDALVVWNARHHSSIRAHEGEPKSTRPQAAAGADKAKERKRVRQQRVRAEIGKRKEHGGGNALDVLASRVMLHWDERQKRAGVQSSLKSCRVSKGGSVYVVSADRNCGGSAGACRAAAACVELQAAASLLESERARREQGTRRRRGQGKRVARGRGALNEERRVEWSGGLVAGGAPPDIALVNAASKAGPRDEGCLRVFIAVGLTRLTSKLPVDMIGIGSKSRSLSHSTPTLLDGSPGQFVTEIRFIRDCNIGKDLNCNLCIEVLRVTRRNKPNNGCTGLGFLSEMKLALSRLGWRVALSTQRHAGAYESLSPHIGALGGRVMKRERERGYVPINTLSLLVDYAGIKHGPSSRSNPSPDAADIIEAFSRNTTASTPRRLQHWAKAADVSGSIHGAAARHTWPRLGFGDPPMCCSPFSCCRLLAFSFSPKPKAPINPGAHASDAYAGTARWPALYFYANLNSISNVQATRADPIESRPATYFGASQEAKSTPLRATSEKTLFLMFLMETNEKYGWSEQGSGRDRDKRCWRGLIESKSEPRILIGTTCLNGREQGHPGVTAEI
ncbi:hypothetical protein DFH08DRAFT_820268 [Mycena albidolilacea]|uniref:Uncharacterized protein n=1 Tax=Mycena albidolilacea TaxID=1033008 RepID=A0AAD7EE60_9AGAR|nr:hypothetical protein DFH08DRAFT_820268 [Mycena albidolilacea]